MDIQEHEDPELGRQRREQRMRYEVLDMVCRATRRDPHQAVSCAPFSETIGAWRDELFRVLDFLDHVGLVRYCGPGPQVCITPRGIDYLYGAGRKSKSVPDEP